MGGGVKRKRGAKSSMGHHQDQEEESSDDDVVKAKKPTAANPDHDNEQIENQSLELQIFLNSLLMENIVKHLPTDTLPILRRTCKLWNQIICPEYRKRNVPCEVIRIDVGDSCSDALIEKFKFKECRENPFGKYILTDLPFINPKIQDLLINIGSIMAHLELQLNSNTCLPIANFKTLLFKQTPALARLVVKDGRSSALEFWKNELQPTTSTSCSSTNMKDLQEEVQKLPNLKEISIRIQTTNVHHETSEFLLINQLFDAAINLQLVEIINWNIGTEDFMNGILLQALKGKADNLGKLREIKFNRQVSLQHLQTLVELSSRKSTTNKLQLKKFNLSLSHLSDQCFSGHGLMLLNQFLTLQGSCLETLIAEPLYGDRKIHLPIMNSLKMLKLQVEFKSTFSDDLGSLRFQSLNVNFPNLVNLTTEAVDWRINPTEEVLSEHNQRKWSAFTRQLGYQNEITHLHFTIYQNGNYLQDLSRIFPNVKSLKIKFFHQVSPQVWTLWPRLESMEIEVSRCKKGEIDSWLTGIPMQSLEALRESKDVGPQLNWKELLKTQPGITDLSCLRELKLWYRGVTNRDVCITDVSGYYGFVANPSIKRIVINKCYDFSPECVSAIEASVGIYGHFIRYHKN